MITIKKQIKKAFIIIICFSIIMIVYSVCNNSKQGEAIKEFYKKKEAYEDIRKFIINEIQENEQKDITIAYTNTTDNVWYYYFSSADRMSFSESCSILDKNVIDSLDVLKEIKGTRFDFCGSVRYKKNKIIYFVYDKEYAFDRRYDIYWCENIDTLKLYIQGEKKYTLKKLGENWYYVGFEE